MSLFNNRMHEEWVKSELFTTLRSKGKMAPVVTIASEQKEKEFAQTVRVFPQTEEAKNLQKQIKMEQREAAKQAKAEKKVETGPTDRQIIKSKLKDLQKEFEKEREARIHLEGEVERLTARVGYAPEDC